jgi:hypothetical protein
MEVLSVSYEASCFLCVRSDMFSIDRKPDIFCVAGSAMFPVW